LEQARQETSQAWIQKGLVAELNSQSPVQHFTHRALKPGPPSFTTVTSGGMNAKPLGIERLVSPRIKWLLVSHFLFLQLEIARYGMFRERNDFWGIA
jgi:hypothetical protein